MTDAVIGAVVTLVVVAAMAADIDGGREPDIGAYLFAAGLGLLMLVRRRQPGLALIATLVGITGYYMAGYPVIGLAVPIAAALYSAAEQGRLRLAVGVALVALVGSTVYRLFDGDSVDYLLGFEAASSVAVMAGAIAVGDGVRSRRQWHAEQRRREEQLIRESEQEAARRIEHERLAVARDLHDVLAHTTAVISLQADVAAEALEDGDVDATRAALAVVRAAAGETTRELRSTVAVLRQPAGGESRAPVASLRHVDDLARTATRGGLPVEVRVEGTPTALPVAVDTTAYRVAQESITNAVRHAQASRVDVLVRYAPDRVEIAVTDDGRGASAGPSARQPSGHGLAGMRERVELIGGTFSAGNIDGAGARHGFAVRAALPLRSAS